MRLQILTVALLWMTSPVRAADLTADAAREIITRDHDEPEFPFDGSVADPLATVGGTPEDTARLEAEAARLIRSQGREAGMFNALLTSADPRLRRLADRFQGVVSLPDVRRLAPGAAQELAGRVVWLILPELVELSPETAAVLGGQGDLAIRLPPDVDPRALEPLAVGCRLTLLGVDDPSPELLEVVAKAAGGLTLPDVVTLRPAAAEVLAAQAGCVTLTGLKELPLDIAAALGGGRPELRLVLSGLAELSPEAAAALLRQREVVVDWCCLTRLPSAVAKLLVGMPADLCLHGVAALDAETAAILARHSHGLYLTGLDRLDVDVLAALAAHKGFLHIGAREPLSAAAAEAFCRRQGQTILTIPGLDAAAARILAQHVKAGGIQVQCTVEPPGEVIDILSTNREVFLDRDRLTTLSVAAAKALAGHEDLALSFERLADIPPEVAAALATDNKDLLMLKGLKTLSPDVARALARHAGDLRLMGLETLDRETALLLARHPGTLCLGLKRLPPDVAGALARHAGPLYLDQLDALDERTAARLVGGPEVLAFNGLPAIDAATAHMLARHDGIVCLFGLDTLPPEIAEPLLADRPAAAGDRLPELQVDFSGLTGLTPRLAEALVRRGEELELLEIARLDSTAAARGLAATRQRIALPGLRQVTMAAFTALKANPLIEVPAGNALEFLPDIPGSTDDFEIP